MSDDLFVRGRPRNKAVRVRRYHIERATEFKKSGLCRRCGQNSVVAPFAHCDDCRDLMRARYREAKGLPADHPVRDNGAKIAKALAASKRARKFSGRKPETPKTGKIWKPHEREALVRLFAEKAPIEQICQVLGRSQRAIFQCGHKLGIPDCDPKNFSTPYIAARIKSW